MAVFGFPNSKIHFSVFLFASFMLCSCNAVVSAGNVRSDLTRFYRDGERKDSPQPFNLFRDGSETSTRSTQLNGKPSSSGTEKGKSYKSEIPRLVTSNPVEDQEDSKNDMKRKFGNARNNEGMNLTANYMSDLENETWNVERKRKVSDFGLDNQSAACRVTTEELVATAQATVTRALKGLCNSNDVEERFQYLESSLLKQLSTIRNMILNLEKRLGEHGDAVLYGQKQLLSGITKGYPGNYPMTPDVNNKNQKSPGHEYTKSGSTDDADDLSEEDASGVRDPEILKFNSSIHVETGVSGSPKKVFTYYWRIKDMDYKLAGWNPWKSFRSQSFYVFPSGYRMYMRIFPRYDEASFNVRVGITKGEFDESLKWPFPLRHKIHILDQTKEGRVFEDIASRIWDPNLLCSDFNWQKPVKGDNHECVEVAFPHDVLKQREYIRRNALVVKLTVYLES